MIQILPATMKSLLAKVEGPSASTRYLAIQDLQGNLGSPQPITRARFEKAAQRGSTYAVSWAGLRKTLPDGMMLWAGMRGQLIEACRAEVYYFVRVPPPQRVYHNTFEKEFGLDTWLPDPKALMEKVTDELNFDARYGEAPTVLYFTGAGTDVSRLHRMDEVVSAGRPFEVFVEWEDGHYLLFGKVQHRLVIPQRASTAVGPQHLMLKHKLMTEKERLLPPIRTKLSVQMRRVDGLELMYRLLKEGRHA